MVKSINLYRLFRNPNQGSLNIVVHLHKFILGLLRITEKSMNSYRLSPKTPDFIQTFPGSLYDHGISLYNHIDFFLVVNSKQKYGKKYGNRVVFSCFVQNLQSNRTTKRGKTNMIVDARCEVYVIVLFLTLPSIETRLLLRCVS